MKKILFSDALFSEDRIYRYALWRTWDDSLPKVLFVGLNPSTADEVQDDPTIRRCIRYAQDWGYGGYIMGNIFGYRSTDPKKLKLIDDPVGIDNNYWLKKLHKEAALTIGAWGNHGKLLDRGEEIVNLLDNLYCLKVTKEGHPSHPLYLSSKLKPINFS
ncbi:MAG: hypothetical protein CMG66_05755 [Candidatus Marinimicrobia bacterium]|nr:hypothetical protein [Candidatus Neomarinimicrobiota bacterium]|tara:strand:+ start:32393 stop:32869 length:477 start_codon:yes stop_codon:yes gene_type:complete